MILFITMCLYIKPTCNYSLQSAGSCTDNMQDVFYAYFDELSFDGAQE